MRNMAASTVLLLSFSSTAWTQSIAVTDSTGKPRWRAAPGEKLTITTSRMKCDPANKEPAVTLGSALLAVEAGTSADAWTVTVPPATDADAYPLTVVCGSDKPSTWLTVVPTTSTVVCVRNSAPKWTERKPRDLKCTASSLWEVREHDQVEIEVYQLDDLRKTIGNKPLRLFVSGIELRNLDLHLSKYNPDTGRSTLWTQLDFDDDNADNRKSWVQLMRLARNRGKLDVSIGPEGGPQFASTAVADYNVYSVGWASFTIVVMLSLLLATFILAARSNLLRGPKCADGPPRFSLARHQMAAWFIIVVSAYLFLMLMTGHAATSSTALILIGISGATGLAAVVIDAQQANQAARDRSVLLAEQTTLQSATTEAQEKLKTQTPPADADTLKATIEQNTKRLAEIAAKLKDLPGTPQKSQGWYLDLLSDENGVSLHRLQIIVWTVVLAGVFVRAVWRDLAMPDFDAVTLALMGVSSGTYLGFKLPS
jgi:hypothetical protein